MDVRKWCTVTPPTSLEELLSAIIPPNLSFIIVHLIRRILNFL